jgi:hypothetical protein
MEVTRDAHEISSDGRLTWYRMLEPGTLARQAVFGIDFRDYPDDVRESAVAQFGAWLSSRAAGDAFTAWTQAQQVPGR